MQTSIKCQTRNWTPEEYFAALHPHASVGSVTLMSLERNREPFCRTYGPQEASAWMPCWLEASAYCTINRHRGPRGAGRLAELNALYADLDVYRVHWLPGGNRQALARVLLNAIRGASLPAPSFLIDSGRGFYALWLINPLPAKAEPRWRAAQKALVEHLAHLGADRACVDAARILRLPGTVNGKVQREVDVVAGDGARHDFDALADAVYLACGRPTRSELVARNAKQKAGASGSTTRGLPPAARFALALQDLEQIRSAWGGEIPEGLRNTWLHLAVTALTHTVAPDEIEACALALAAAAVPTLSPREIDSTIRTGVARAERVVGAYAGPWSDPRLSYSGAEMAARLGVETVMAKALSLRQIIPESVRRDRRNAKRRAAHVSAGGVSREAYLAANTISKDAPWIAAGVSRRTWYRRRRAKMDVADLAVAAKNAGTGPVPQQGGHSPAGRPAEIEDRRP